MTRAIQGGKSDSQNTKAGIQSPNSHKTYSTLENDSKNGLVLARFLHTQSNNPLRTHLKAACKEELVAKASKSVLQQAKKESLAVAGLLVGPGSAIEGK
jgi:hypothetical protein